MWDKEVRDLSDEIALLEDNLAIEQRANRMQSEFLQRKLSAMSEKANTMEEKFDKDTADKTKELDALKEEREATLVRLFELEKVQSLPPTHASPPLTRQREGYRQKEQRYSRTWSTRRVRG